MAGFQVTAKDDISLYAEYFDRRVTIEQFVASSDGQGGQTTGSWIPFLSTWAHLEPWKGSEAWLAQQVYPVSYERVLIRYRKTVNISSAMRLHYKSRIFNIRWVGVPTESRKVIELLCEELQAKGSVA